ncbi:hypothetical protein CsSME_00043294 [Camellia sinensis var. sinensis]
MVCINKIFLRSLQIAKFINWKQKCTVLQNLNRCTISVSGNTVSDTSLKHQSTLKSFFQKNTAFKKEGKKRLQPPSKNKPHKTYTKTRFIQITSTYSSSTLVKQNKKKFPSKFLSFTGNKQTHHVTRCKKKNANFNWGKRSQFHNGRNTTKL